MTTISEDELARIVDGICADRESIIRHNPIGSDEEVLLWMLLSCLVSYLSLGEQETPCFTGRPDASTYRNAVLFVLRNTRSSDFDASPYLDRLSTC